MNTRTLLSLLALSTINSQLSTSASAQGSLTPPAGPPVASMKTLDQVEARTAVQSLSATAPYTITQPGSYYLTGNITVASGNAIKVNSNDVIIDLNGFTIRSTQSGAASGAAISFDTDIARLTVRNGTIASGSSVSASFFTAAGFQVGIGSNTAYLRGSLIADVHVSGTSMQGIQIDSGGVVERCTVKDCGGTGITADVISRCTATNCRYNGILAVASVSECSGEGLHGAGIISHSTAANCTGRSMDSIGLSCQTATNCKGTTASGPQAMLVSGTASFCRGERTGGGGGTTIHSAIAIGCTTDGGSIVSAQKHLGTP